MWGSHKQSLVLLSASSVSSNKFDSIDNIFTNDDNIKVLNTNKSILLNKEQQSLIPIENVSQFCDGAIAAYLLETNNDIDFESIQKANKLSKDDIFNTQNSFFIASLRQILFPQS